MYFTSGNDRAFEQPPAPARAAGRGGTGIGKLGVGKSNIG